MNKKGYIRTFEAVIALVIIFTAIIFLLPKNKLPDGKAPHELENTANEILKAIQQNSDFRNGVLSINPVIVNNKIRSTLPSFTPWTYAFTICNENQMDLCDNNHLGKDFREEGIVKDNFNLPSKDIYTKSVFLSNEDITDDAILGANNENIIIRIYFWEKE